MRIAIIGAGPAGSHLAYKLSRYGFKTMLFDEREAWEKPCGGGVTSKALREFKFLNTTETPKRMISDLRLISAQNKEINFAPSQDFAIYSRKELAQAMRKRAIDAGAELHCMRVEKTERINGEWNIETSERIFTADFLVGADGASSRIRRRVGVRFKQSDFAYALGWNVYTPNISSRVDVKYMEECGGYIWQFPRTDHISYGIAAGYRDTKPIRLKELLVDFMNTMHPDESAEIKESGYDSTLNCQFYAAMIPALSPETWDDLKVSNAEEKWALIGDAAGFVDPLTGEGIYYAIKSADILAEALLNGIDQYDRMWRDAFGAELRKASQMQDRFYLGNFFGAPLTERMIQFASHHSGIRNVLCDLIAGDQGYVHLKSRLLRSLVYMK